MVRKMCSIKEKWSSRTTLVGMFVMVLICLLFWLAGNPTGAAKYVIMVFSLMIGGNKFENFLNVNNKEKDEKGISKDRVMGS